MIKQKIAFASACTVVLATSLTASMASAATGSANLTIQSFGQIGTPVTLLNDGRAVDSYVVYEPFTLPPECDDPWVNRPQCRPKAIFAGLELTRAGQAPQKLEDQNFLGRYVKVNHRGQAVSWTSLSDFSILDINTGVSTPLPPASEEVLSKSCLNTAVLGYDTGFWRHFSDNGTLVGLIPDYCSKPSNSFFLWSGKEAPQEVPAPNGHSNLYVVDINAADQVLLNASDRVVTKSPSIAEATNKVFTWSKAKGYKALTPPWLSGLLGFSIPNAVKINDAGDVAGNLYNKSYSVFHAVVWRNGVATDIGIQSGYKFSYVLGITSTGTVVACGYNNRTDSTSQLLLWDKGTLKKWTPTAPGTGASIPMQYCGKGTRLKASGPMKANQNGQWLLETDVDATYLVPALN